MQRKRKQHTCMFDWQATQTQPCLFSTLSKGESHFRSLVCIMRNSKYASTSIMCTLRNSKCAFRIKIQNTHFAVVWKQSKSSFSAWSCDIIVNWSGINFFSQGSPSYWRWNYSWMMSNVFDECPQQNLWRILFTSTDSFMIMWTLVKVKADV